MVDRASFCMAGIFFDQDLARHVPFGANRESNMAIEYDHFHLELQLIL